jgi:hypothetical protein
VGVGLGVVKMRNTKGEGKGGKKSFYFLLCVRNLLGGLAHAEGSASSAALAAKNLGRKWTHLTRSRTPKFHSLKRGVDQYLSAARLYLTT